ncbi:MAG: metal-dependent transcriptional regulator [Ignavibacteria bacterium]|nr:metal-dependent transcriptional regulator [Ignavibacteria bacterium]
MENISYIYIILSLFLIILSLLFLPRLGLVHLWRKSKETSNRILVENALKHIYDCEYKKLTSSIKSIAGALSIKLNKAVALVQKLQTQKLIETKGEEIRLSEEGRKYALQVIRTHRIWERHLADETSVNEARWHIEAEKKEHFLSREDVDKLAANLGQPLFDPHGDPIPSETGNLPEDKGIQITNLKAGDKARIVHVEDEPDEIYSELVKRGIRSGLTFEIIKNTSEEITIKADGHQINLTPLLSANISVLKLLKIKEPETLDYKTLTKLKSGEIGIIKVLSTDCRGQQRRRLMDLGFLPGTEISIEMKSPTGDPTAYKVRNTIIALRKQQAEKIYIENSID